MKATLPSLLFSAIAWSMHGAWAFDWDAAGKNLGVVEAINMTTVPLAQGNVSRGTAEKPADKWVDIPAVLGECKAKIYVSANKLAGITEYKVTKGGWVFFAGYFGGEGADGAWNKERKDEEKLQEEGWIELSNPETGGPLTSSQGNAEWKIFARLVTAGGKEKLRVNKYSPPAFLAFSQPPTGHLASNAPSVPAAPPSRSAPPPAPATTDPGVPSKPANPTPALMASKTPVPPASEGLNASDIVKTNRSNLVFVTTPDGAGSGFIANYGTGTFLITNAHVAAGAKGAMFKTLEGNQVQIGAPAVAVGHDIFLMGLPPSAAALQVMMGVDQNTSIDDEVVVLGNAEGAGVINTIKGKIVGLGPNLVEVDAPFRPGNSGSPIIHLKTGKVIGVATYLTIRRYDSATKEAVKAPIIRRFGYRLDSVKSWQPVNWQSFYAQANEMEGIEKLTKDLVAFLRDLGKDGRVNRGAHTNPVIKTRIDQWIEAKAKRLSPRDASTADQSMISFLKVTCQSDVGGAQQHLTYDYFQRQLADQQRERTELAGVFSKIIDNLRQ